MPHNMRRQAMLARLSPCGTATFQVRLSDVVCMSAAHLPSCLFRPGRAAQAFIKAKHRALSGPLPGLSVPTAWSLQDGQQWQPETVVYCTGYKYSYPWLPDGILDISAPLPDPEQQLWIISIISP